MRWNGIQRDYRNGIIKYDDYQKEINKLVQDIGGTIQKWKV